MSEIQEKLKKLNQFFSPAAPIEQKDLFFGRIDQLGQIVHSVQERGQHAVLYGERGVGKTSLANIIHHSPFANIISVKVTCNRNDSYKGVWERALSKISFIRQEVGIGYTPEIKDNPFQLNLFIQDKTDITSSDLEVVFEKLNSNLLFIFDEFDSIRNAEIKERFADTLKSLSDNAPNVTVLIVGIAEDVNELLGSHASLERCLRQIQLPRMSEEELGEIIDHGFEFVGLKIKREIRNKIIDFSSGFPHYTHLLAKYTAESAISTEKKLADEKDFDYAINKAIINAQQQIRNDFQKAIISSKEIDAFENILYAVSQSQCDEFGNSSANQILIEFNKIAGKKFSRERATYYLKELCKAERAEVLIKIGTSKNIKYRFRSPLMKSFLKLKYYHKCLPKISK